MTIRSKTEIEGRTYTKADLYEFSDAPEFIEEEMARAKPFAEAFPELVRSAKHMRGKQRASTKQLISLRLDREVIQAFKARGPGRQRLINNDALGNAIRRD